MSAPATTNDGRPAKSGFPWLLTLVSLIAFAILFSLGTWQVARLTWKEGLIQVIDSRLAMTPVPLDEALGSLEVVAQQEYRPVIVEGIFHHDWERHFFATHEGASGYFVYTPLERAGGDYVFVNRGFVPFDLKDAAKRQQGQLAGPVRVTGLLRSALTEKPSSMVPDNDLPKNIFYWKDIRAMASSSGMPAGAKLLVLFVDADKTPNPGGWPVGGVTLIDLPNNHLQYAVTWYGLAAALLGVLFVFVWRSQKGKSMLHKLAVLTGLVFAVAGICLFPFLSLAADTIHNKIDRCDDSSSGRYILDDEDRAKACGRV